MKTQHFCFCVIAFLISLTSCQKDFRVSDNLVQNPAALSTDSIYLDKIYDINVVGSVVDTQDVITLNYDALKRVAFVTVSVPNTPSSVSSTTETYYYSGTDTLPYKSINVDINSQNIDSTASYFTYNSALKTRDSIVVRSQNGNYSLKVVNYSYAPGLIYGLTRSNDPIIPGVSTFQKDTAITDGRGNIITDKNYFLSGTQYMLNRISNFTFDNKPAPLSKLNIFKAIREFPNAQSFDNISFNNMLTLNEITFNPQTSYQDFATYQYHPITGLPVKIIFGGSLNQYQIYKYKKL